jgi:hypothetical protein
MARTRKTRAGEARRWLRPIAAVAIGLLLLACADIDEGDVAGADDDADQPPASDDDADVEVIEMEVDPDHEGEVIELEYWSFIDTHVEFLTRRAEEFNAMAARIRDVHKDLIRQVDERSRLLVALPVREVEEPVRDAGG